MCIIRKCVSIIRKHDRFDKVLQIGKLLSLRIYTFSMTRLTCGLAQVCESRASWKET